MPGSLTQHRVLLCSAHVLTNVIWLLNQLGKEQSFPQTLTSLCLIWIRIAAHAVHSGSQLASGA